MVEDLRVPATELGIDLTGVKAIDSRGDLYVTHGITEQHSAGSTATRSRSSPAEVWDISPMMEFLIENTADPNRISFLVTGVYRFRVGVRRSGRRTPSRPRT